MGQEKPIQVALRVPPAMHAKLKAMADEDRRSLHAEILIILEDAIERREARAEENPEGKAAA